MYGIRKNWQLKYKANFRYMYFFYNKTGIFNVVYKQVKKSFKERYTSYITCANTCSLKTSLKKTKSVAFYESHPVRAKIVTHGHILEQVSYFQYLRCEIPCAYDKEVENKLHCYQTICETIQRPMRRETDRNTIKILYSNGNTSIVTQN
jgi:hypothetical protein